MAKHLFSFCAVNGSDLDELHIGHAAFLMRLRSALRRSRNVDLTIIFNQREAYGMRPGLSSRNIRAYEFFFERLFAALGVTDARSRISVVRAPDFIKELNCEDVLQSVKSVFSRLEQIVGPLDAVSELTDEQIEKKLRESLGDDAICLDLIASAVRPFVVSRDVKAIRIFEEMACHNTAILATIADNYKTEALVVAGKRHSYKYNLSKAVIAHLGLQSPKYTFVPNISDVFGHKHMQARGGAPPIFITATQEEIEKALVDSQKYLGPKLAFQILDGILQRTGGIRIGQRLIKKRGDLEKKDIARSDFVHRIGKALYRALEPLRRARTEAYDETRGDYIEFSASGCLETLTEEFNPPSHSFPTEANEAPLKYREEFLLLQDRALRYAQDGLYETVTGRSVEKACSLAKASVDIDVLSYFTSKRYRDHHIHVLNVLYAGWVLLGLRLIDGTPLKTHVARALKWNEESAVETAWILTALLHDHCYPVAFALAHTDRMSALSHHYGTAAVKIIDAVNESMGRMLGPRIRTIVGPVFSERGVDHPAERLWGHLQGLFAEEMRTCGAVSQELAFDHGVLSALNLLDYSSVTERPNNKDLSQDHILFESARSILLHNLTHCVKDDGRIRDVIIKFKDNPLGALLVLCDEMQEWGRTCLGPKGYQTMIGRMVCGPIDNDVLDEDVLRCTFEYTHDAQKEFYQWNFDLFAQGKAKNLRRLSFAGIPFPAKFEFSVGIHGMSIDLMD